MVCHIIKAGPLQVVMTQCNMSRTITGDCISGVHHQQLIEWPCLQPSMPIRKSQCLNANIMYAYTLYNNGSRLFSCETSMIQIIYIRVYLIPLSYSKMEYVALHIQQTHSLAVYRIFLCVLPVISPIITSHLVTMQGILIISYFLCQQNIQWFISVKALTLKMCYLMWRLYHLTYH